MSQDGDDTVPRRKRQLKPPPADAEAERKRLLLKVERLALKKVVKLISSGVESESEFDFMAGESRRALEMAEDARAMLDGRPLPVRAEPKEGQE